MVLLRFGQALTRSSEVTSQRTTNVRFDLYFLRIPNSAPHRRLTSCFQNTFFTVAIAILSFYGGGVILYKITSALTSKPKPVETVAVTKVEAPTTGVPGIETAAFEKWVETDALEKLLSNDKQLEALVESL
jgi:hypothetical protein